MLWGLTDVVSSRAQHIGSVPDSRQSPLNWPSLAVGVQELVPQGAQAHVRSLRQEEALLGVGVTPHLLRGLREDVNGSSWGKIEGFPPPPPHPTPSSESQRR